MHKGPEGRYYARTRLPLLCHCVQQQVMSLVSVATHATKTELRYTRGESESYLQLGSVDLPTKQRLFEGVDLPSTSESRLPVDLSCVLCF